MYEKLLRDVLRKVCRTDTHFVALPSFRNMVEHTAFVLA